LISDEFSVTLMDIDVYDIRVAGHPLVILNACETGSANPLYTSYFAGAFLKLGARGVVATECPVPDTFAAAFAKQLYAHLLSGRPLGASLLAARRHFLDQDHNPAGLLYAMYAPPSIRLAIEEELEQAVDPTSEWRSGPYR
jgi:CHAT domain-containing protein